VRVILIITTI